jgi:hypothetical protein
VKTKIFIATGTLLLCCGLVGAVKIARIHAMVGNKYELSEIQKLRIKVKLEDAQLIQQQLNAVQAQFNAAVGDFNKQVEDTRKENKIPEGWQINMQTMEFVAPTPPKK